VKVLKSKKKVTSLQVKVKFKFFTSLHVEVPESLLKYCNEVFLLRYRPTLIIAQIVWETEQSQNTSVNTLSHTEVPTHVISCNLLEESYRLSALVRLW
jgi:hypothetical protein